MIVVWILRFSSAHEKEKKDRTERRAQHNYTHIEDHPQIVLHPIHHSTRTNSSLVATLHLFVVNQRCFHHIVVPSVIIVPDVILRVVED